MAASTDRASDAALLRVHVEALFTHDADGLISRVNEPGGGRAPRFYFGRTREGTLWRFREDLPEGMVRALDELARREPVGDDRGLSPQSLAAFHMALGDEPGSSPEHAGPAYRFPEALPALEGIIGITVETLHLVEAMGPGWAGFGAELPEREPCMAVIENGLAVSVCFSARLTECAAEAGVETQPLYRGRGYAPRVVAAWAGAVRASGRIPLYSTSWENAASQAVARKLGLIQYAADLSL